MRAMSLAALLALAGCGLPSGAGSATPTPTAATVRSPGTASASVASAVATPASLGTAPATPTPVVVRYLCAEGKTFEARVFQAPLERAILVIEGRTIEMRQERAASGVRYTDGTLTYVSKGPDAYIQQGEVITYRDCRAQ